MIFDNVYFVCIAVFNFLNVILHRFSRDAELFFWPLQGHEELTVRGVRNEGQAEGVPQVFKQREQLEEFQCFGVSFCGF